MAIAYFDCASGVAGDMVLGALIDAGLPVKLLERELSKVVPQRFCLSVGRKLAPVRGTDLKIVVTREIEHPRYVDIDRMIAKSRLEKGARELARSIFEVLARAEAKVHGVRINQVHFHEVGNVDSIVDIVGGAIGFEYFKFRGIFASPLPMTRGKSACVHGVMPVPPPAVLEILKGVPFERSHIRGEIVTPTGAAILRTVVRNFGECPLQTVERVAYGYGDKELPNTANALRLMIGEGFPAVVIETDIDDMNPQLFAPVMERLFSLGAVDVSLLPLQMKKGRPAVRISAMAPWEKRDAVINALLRETTTFGVRYFPVERRILERRLVVKRLKRNGVTFKAGYDSNGKLVKISPEFESVRRLAKKKGRTVMEMYRKVSFLQF